MNIKQKIKNLRALKLPDYEREFISWIAAANIGWVLFHYRKLKMVKEVALMGRKEN